MPLTDTAIRTAKPGNKPVKMADGGGLYLEVAPSGGKAREWYASYSPTLSEKHAKKLHRYLEKLIFPAFGSKGVSAVEPSDILAVARPKEAQGV